ncbi:MAG: transcription antitermination protein NusB [Akkermansia sp.]
MMNFRSLVRRSVLTYLYALYGSGEGSVDASLFWEIALEKERDRYRRELAKALMHRARGAVDACRVLSERAEALELAMHGDLTTGTLREGVADYTRRAVAWAALPETLRRRLADKRLSSTEPVEQMAGELVRGAATLLQLGAELLPRLADAAVYRTVTQPMEGVLHHLEYPLRAVAELADPLTATDTHNLGALLRYAHLLAELPPAARELAEAVLAYRPKAEALLAELVEHYAPERLGGVERAILCIALYELFEQKLELPIVVSEAISMADEYAGGNSAPFIHGILAAAGKKL